MRSQTYLITRCFLKSITASFTFRNIYPKAIALSSLEESKKEEIGSDPKILTVPKVTIGRLFSKKVLFLKLPTTCSISILEETVFTMSWDN